MGIITPVARTERDNVDLAGAADRLLYVKSFLLMRVLVGIIGVLLPTVLLLGNIALTHGIEVRGSLSSYYHSGMRDFFVSSLCAIGVFLVAYKVAERNLDNTVTFVAGIAAIGVAIFPTTRIKGENGEPIGLLTPLQDLFHEQPTATVHFVCAIVTMIGLGLMSLFFGIREADRRKHNHPTRVRWDLVHYGCAAVIALALLLVGLSKALDVFDKYSVLVGEAVMLYAFGVSWFFKGFERKVLSVRSPTTPEPGPNNPPTISPSKLPGGIT